MCDFLTKECKDDSASAGASQRMLAQFGQQGLQNGFRVGPERLQAALDAEVAAVEAGFVLRKVSVAAGHCTATKCKKYFKHQLYTALVSCYLSEF